MSQDQNLWFAWTATSLWTFIELYLFFTTQIIKPDYFVIMVIVWILYIAQNSVDLNPIHFGLLIVFLSIHFTGALGPYAQSFYGIGYDKYIHFFGGFVMLLLCYHAIAKITQLTGAKIYAGALVLLLAISAIHEIFEFGSGMILGQGDGVLFIGDGDNASYDTQKDMITNILGGLVAIAGIILLKKFRRL